MIRAEPVLFTRGLSSIAQLVRAIREDMVAGEYLVHASYDTAFTPLAVTADRLHLEPPRAEDEAYADWLIGLCQREGIAIVWPQSRVRALLSRVARFTQAGIRLLLPTPDADTFDQIDDKLALLARVARAAPEVSLPDYRPVRTGRQFRDALRELGDGGRPLCIKPARGIYGGGFRRLDEAVSPLRRWLDNDVTHATTAEIEALLDLSDGERVFLVMEYLPGPERSLDCLADRGRLRAAIVRRKGVGRGQAIEDSPSAVALTGHLADLFRLHGVFNLQTRERADGCECLLEINARMSGGLDMCRAAGCNLPLAALRMASGRLPVDWVAEPHRGAVVALLEAGVRIA